MPLRPGQFDVTFSYDPGKVNDGSVNQMRFELADTCVNTEDQENCSVMCDEEYKALIEKEGSWRKAKISCLKHILMIFMYQVDFTIDGLSIKYSDRYNRFKKLLDDLLREEMEDVPGIDKTLMGNIKAGGGHYFYYGMLENSRKF